MCCQHTCQNLDTFGQWPDRIEGNAKALPMDVRLSSSVKQHSDISIWRNLYAALRLYAVGAVVLCLQLIRGLHPRRPHTSHTQSSSHEYVPAVAILTGATSGIGRQLVTALQDRGTQIIALVHDAPHDLPLSCDILPIDLGSLQSTREAAQLVGQRVGACDGSRKVVLFHCAGILLPPHDSVGALKYDPTLTINFIAPACLTYWLSPFISAMVWLGSSSQAAAPRQENMGVPLSVVPQYAAYPLSKLFAAIFSEFWSTQSSRPAMVIHPGVVHTGLYGNERGIVGQVLRMLVRRVAWEPKHSAECILQTLSSANAGALALPACGVYWDATTAKQELLPRHVRNPAIRRQLAEALWRDIQNLATSNLAGTRQ